MQNDELQERQSDHAQQYADAGAVLSGSALFPAFPAGAAEREETGAAMRRSEDKWKFFFDNAPDGYFITDPEGTILFANRRSEELAGRGRNELIGMSCLDETLLFPADAPKARAILERGARGESSGPEEFQVVTRNGQGICLEISVHPVLIENARLLLCIARDNTRHRSYEESLRKANARLQALVHAMPDMVFFKDVEGRYVMVNKAVEKVTGLPAEGLIGRTAADHLLPEAAVRCAASDDEALRGDRPLHAEEYLSAGDGGLRHFDVIKSPIHDARGTLLGLVSVCRDITERRRMEDALRKSEKFIRDILESVDEGFIVIDRDHRIISANKAYLEQVKRPSAEVIGRKCHVVSHDSDKACYEHGEECAVRQTFESGEPSTALHIHRDRDQDLVYVETKAYPLKDEEGRTVAAIEIVNNVTEKKRLEEQLRHAQKMEAVGQLAGGIAHDFNNILTTIIGYGSIVKKQLGENDPLHHDVAQILESSERAASLTRGLLTFSRKQAITPYRINVNEVIGNMEKLLRRIIGEDVHVEVTAAGSELIVMADLGQLEQVLMNLATNAKDAMPDGGRLTITTGRVVLDQEFIRRHGFGKRGDYARITVADTGVGLDARTKAKIFEPFFTTKGTGKGTGLGLSIVYGIVKQHNGFIACESELRKGTIFNIYLPMVQGETVKETREAPAAVAGGTETILLVEDDAAVRQLMRSVLQRNGYSVIEAVDGEDAIERFREHRKSIALVLLDVIMPRKNGKEAYLAMEKERPGVKAIFVSGYTADIVTAESILAKGITFLAKPVPPLVLLKRVREVLDSPGSAPAAS